MMLSRNLSYVVTTYNKIEYLKLLLPPLLNYRKEDEEIVVVDGKSSDGTAEYLQELYDRQLIQKFVSERDFGEGHGFNKGILMAEGQVIKLLSDDDVFSYPAIQYCKNYMLEHPEVDFLNTHGGWYDLAVNNDPFVFTKVYETEFEKWAKSGAPFAFCMLGAMINRKSLSFLGLLNPSIKRADAEYSLRITSQKIKLAWYLGPAYVRILNQQSNSARYEEIIKMETGKLNSYYGVLIDGEQDRKPQSLVDTVKGRLIKTYRLLRSNGKTSPNATPVVSRPDIPLAEALRNATEWLESQNRAATYAFLNNA